jgi:tungstate transport system substrate-binding protein
MTFSPLGRGALICAIAAACTSKPPVRVGTTYTVQQSGALDLLDALKDSAPARFVVAIGPSGQMLRSAAAGDLDIVLAHAPAQEARILAGRWSRRCPFGASRFAIVGPRSDPAQVAAATSAVDAMRRLARSGAMFVSRGDSSGTHEKERALWRLAGLDPQPGGETYFETGGDQATTLRLANEWGAYALADLPTLARQHGLALAVLFANDPSLANPYTLYVVRADSVAPGADSVASWMLARWRPRVLALRLADSTPAFSSILAGCESLAPH